MLAYSAPPCPPILRPVPLCTCESSFFCFLAPLYGQGFRFSRLRFLMYDFSRSRLFFRRYLSYCFLWRVPLVRHFVTLNHVSNSESIVTHFENRTAFALTENATPPPSDHVLLSRISRSSRSPPPALYAATSPRPPPPPRPCFFYFCVLLQTTGSFYNLPPKAILPTSAPPPCFLALVHLFCMPAWGTRGQVSLC